MTVKIEAVMLDGLLPEWGDSLGLESLNGEIHAVAQARRAIYSSNKHYVINPTTGQITGDLDAPFTPNAEFIVSKKANALYFHSGTGDYSIWKFDPAVAGLSAASYSQISANTLAELGDRRMGVGTYCPVTDKFYRFGGINGSSYVRSSTMLDGSWEDMGLMPASIRKLSGCASCYYNGKFYFLGGSSNLPGTATADLYAGELNGEVWSYDTLTDTWTLEYTNRLIFASLWCDCAPLIVDGVLIGIVYSRGYISSSQITTFDAGDVNVNVRQANNRGVYISNGLDLTDWTRIDEPESLDVLAFETHRRGMVSHGNYVFLVEGYNDNGLLRVNVIP